MVEKLIAFLQWIQGSESLKKGVDKTFSLLVLFVAATALWKVWMELFSRCNYYYYSGCMDNVLPGNELSWKILSVFLILSIITSLGYGVVKKILSYEYSVMRLVLNTTLPFYVGLILIFLWSKYADSTGSGGPGWYIYLFGGLYAVSPIFAFIKENLKSEGILKKSLSCYSRYILSFLIGFAVFLVIFFFGNMIREFRYMDFSEIVLFLFMVFLGFAIGTWIVLTYAWDEVKPIDDIGSRSIRKYAVILAGLFVCIWLSPDWKQFVIGDRIGKAQEILTKKGNTEEGYRDAAGVWGLKWAMKEAYLDNTLYGYNKDLYAKIFDRTIESDIDDEIDVNTYRSRSSNGTNMLARGENAKVELNFAKHESEIKADIGALETTVTYEFQNTDTQNQEVIYTIELPSSESVVTDLRLGLNLELTGVLAPRGAAAQVYNDSLRRNTDPALLEQTGPNTYRLRVFPVPSVNDERTQGRQRVSFRYITPIASGEYITVMPKTDILNLKLTNKSEIVTRVMEGTKALVQDSWKTDDIGDLIAGKKASVKIEGSLKETLSYCAINTYEGIDMKAFSGSEKNLTKNIVFLDISKSAGESKSTKKRYQELIDTWKNNGAALDIYTFNTLVTSAGYDLSDLEFWGNTDMASVISYIDKNGITNANIVILTDDDSYENVSAEDKTLDYKTLRSNRIALIQIGDKIRTLKTEATKAILATQGEVYRLPTDADIDTAVKDLFAPKNPSSVCENYTGTQNEALSALEGARDGKKVIGETFYATGKYMSGFIYPVYLDDFEFYNRKPIPCTDTSITNGSTSYDCYNSYYMIPDKEGKITKVYSNRILRSDDLDVRKPGYYIFDNEGNLESSPDVNGIPLYIERYGDIGYEGILERIGLTANIVNQSVSLIALENDQQRRDLERYSNQENKYDTTYNNFDNSSSTPSWNRREIMMDNNMEISRRGPTAVQASTIFASSKAAELQLGSSDSSIGGLVSGGSSSGGGGLLQYIIAIVLFPVLAWYILRKKKPKPTPEAPSKDEKPV